MQSIELRESVLITDKGQATQRCPSVSILLMSSVQRASQPLSATDRDLRFISLRTIGECVCMCVFVPWRASVHVLIKAVGVARNDCACVCVRCLPGMTVDVYVNS